MRLLRQLARWGVSRNALATGIAGAPPTLLALALSNSSIPENSGAGTIVGTILNGQGGTFSLSVDGGGRFTIASGKIVATATATDYETATSHSITIVETLAGATGSPKSTVLTIAVANLNDTNPTAFTFTDVTGVSPSAAQTSNTITVAGLGASDSASAAVSGDASSQLQKNGGAWVSGPVTVVNGDTIAVRHTSSSTAGTVVNTTLTIGTTTDTFSSTTAGGTYLSGITYDTRFGSGTDANGYANLPLRAGASRYYVKNGGSDANAGTNPTLPLATIEAALAKVTQNNGDQVCVAQGSTWSTVFPSVTNKHGFSLLYPTVIQSYDPADPTNEAKMGRATGTTRPVWTGSMAGGFLFIGAATSPMQNFAMRGIDINPGNTAGQGFAINGSNGLSPHGLLFENNLFRYTYFALGGQAGKLACNDIVIRGNGFYGSWSTGTMCQGAYVSAVNNCCIEDNVFWHCGWKIGGSRDDAASAGGPTIYNHNLYFQDDAAGIIRRNLTIQGAATGLSTRGHVDLSGNVAINNPISIIGGLGTQYNSKQPYGVAVFMGFNGVIGSEDLSTAAPRGTAFHTGNGKSGSTIHHNLAVKARPSGTPVGAMFSAQANYPQPSYSNWHDNVGYQWSTSGNSYGFGSGSVDGNDYSSYAANNAVRNNNYWDDPAGGTNLNIASLTGIVTAYDANSLCTSFGFADAPTAFASWAANPDTRPAQAIRNRLFTGYGRPTAAPLETLLLAHDWFMVGTTAKCLVMGVQDGSTLSATGLPSCFTLDGPNRCLSYDGTGTPTTGTISITETPVGGSAKTSSISYQIVATTAAPVLSSPTAVSASTTSVTFGVTTDKGNGTLYYVVTTSPTQPNEYDFIVDGLAYTQGPPQLAANLRGSIAVSSAGAKTVTVTGLTTGTTYYCHWTHLDPLFQTSGMTSSAGVAPTASNVIDNGTESELSLNGDTYTSATHTVTAGSTNPATILGTWLGILNIGQVYNFSFTVNHSQGPDVRINDGNAKVWSYFDNQNPGNTIPLNTDVACSGSFTATGTAFKLQASGGTFVGQIKNITVS
jgi:hypothetical protein